MSNEENVNSLYEDNLKTIACTVELIVNSLSSMAGGIISANLNGENLNKQTLSAIVASKINSRLHGKGVLQ